MIHIIANPLAGGGKSVAAASSLARAISDAGISCHVHVTSTREDTVATARKHAALGVVVACGGDGTVHDCLQGVLDAGAWKAGARPRMGIWPTGTGNDIARGLGLIGVGKTESESIDWGSSDAHVAFVDAVVNDSVLATDVGVIVDAGEEKSTYFLGVASCGFDSDVNERANAMPARVGRARYLLGLARELPAMRPRWYAIDSDGTDRSMAAMVVAIGNGPAYGSGMMICPDAQMSDGLLDVTIVTNAPKRTFVSVLPQVYSGRHVEHPSVESWQAKRIRLDAPQSVVYADGERIGALPATIEVLPAAVDVFIPSEQQQTHS